MCLIQGRLFKNCFRMGYYMRCAEDVYPFFVTEDNRDSRPVPRRCTDRMATRSDDLVLCMALHQTHVLSVRYGVANPIRM